MIQQVLKNKADNFFRLVLLNSYARHNASVLLTEYPKSGGSWLGEMIAELIEIDFPRNQFPSLKRSIFHGHYLPKMGIPTGKKVICLIRDGRDVTVSYYFHQLFTNEKTQLNKKEEKYYKKVYGFNDVNDVVNNMPTYIDVLNTHRPSKWFHFFHPTTWSNFYKEWEKYRKQNDNVIFIRYEELKQTPHDALRKITDFLEESQVTDEAIAQCVEKYSFKNQSQRKEGSEDRASFLRKGIIGDWKNYFNERSKVQFKKHAGKALIQFQYEDDNDW